MFLWAVLAHYTSTFVLAFSSETIYHIYCSITEENIDGFLTCIYSFVLFIYIKQKEINCTSVVVRVSRLANEWDHDLFSDIFVMPLVPDRCALQGWSTRGGRGVVVIPKILDICLEVCVIRVLSGSSEEATASYFSSSTMSVLQNQKHKRQKKLLEEIGRISKVKPWGQDEKWPNKDLNKKKMKTKHHIDTLHQVSAKPNSSHIQKNKKITNICFKGIKPNWFVEEKGN